MVLEHRTDMALPTHRQLGGFDQAAVHRASARLYVAHTANDALDVIDCARDRYLHSIAGLTSVAVPGRTRWTVFDPHQEVFFVNIADPTQIARVYDVPAAGPHGLDLDAARGRLFCACDAGTLMCLEARSGQVLEERALSGAPDVISLNARFDHLYVAIGEPGVIDVFDTHTMQRI